MGEKPLILFQDEARFGRIGDVRTSWAPKGMRPVCKNQFVREYFYVYSSVSPDEGELFILILSEASTEAMNVFCKELSKTYPERKILMFMDKAGWHVSKKLKLPENLSIEFLPPYSPELNPQENIWKYYRTNYFANIYFDSLKSVEDTLMNEIPILTKDKNKVKSIAGYGWIINSLLMAN